MALGLIASSAGADGLPRFDWGTSREAVAAAHATPPLVRPAERLVYHGRLAGLEMTLTYRFEDDALVQVRFHSRERHEDRNRYIADYERLRERLTRRHGSPAIDRKAWRNPLLRERPARHGDAVAAGHLVYYAEWRTARASIVTTLHGDRLAVAHTVVYSAPGRD